MCRFSTLCLREAASRCAFCGRLIASVGDFLINAGLGAIVVGRVKRKAEICPRDKNAPKCRNSAGATEIFTRTGGQQHRRYQETANPLPANVAPGCASEAGSRSRARPTSKTTSALQEEARRRRLRQALRSRRCIRRLCTSLIVSRDRTESGRAEYSQRPSRGSGATLRSKDAARYARPGWYRTTPSKRAAGTQEPERSPEYWPPRWRR